MRRLVAGIRARRWLLAAALFSIAAVGVEYQWLAKEGKALRAELAGLPTRPVSKPATAALAESRLPDFPPLSHYRDLTERPPFVPSRRPPTVEPKAIGQAVEESRLGQHWKLVGVVVAPDQTHAVLHERRGGRSVTVSVGMSLDGWQVASVEAESVQLTSGQRTVVLELHPPEEKPQPTKQPFRGSGVYTPR